MTLRNKWSNPCCIFLFVVTSMPFVNACLLFLCLCCFSLSRHIYYFKLLIFFPSLPIYFLCLFFCSLCKSFLGYGIYTDRHVIEFVFHSASVTRLVNWFLPDNNWIAIYDLYYCFCLIKENHAFALIRRHVHRDLFASFRRSVCNLHSGHSWCSR